MTRIKRSKMFLNVIKLFIMFMLIEIVFKSISGFDVFDVSLIRIALSSLFIASILAFIYSWLGKIISKIFIILTVIAFSIYAFIQLGFNNFIGVYMSVNTSSQLGAVIDYIREFFASFLPNYYLVFIPLGMFIIYEIFFDKYLSNYKKEKPFMLKKYSKYEYTIRTVKTAILLIVISLFYYGTLNVKFMQNELQPVSNKALFNYPSIPSITINEFGVLGFCFLDIKTLYQSDSTMLVYEEEKVIQDTNRFVDDSLWKYVSEEENNKVIKNINNYLLNQSITNKNEYTGMFKDKNVIIIMLESTSDIFINKEYYPNFYKMYTEGWSWKNNYSPRNSCSTGNNEFSALTGLYSIYNDCTSNIYANNKYPTSIFNLFNNSGYYTTSMHNYTEAYYKRSQIHDNMGSQKYYGVEDLGINYYNGYRNWSSDVDFFSIVNDIIDKDRNNQKYMSFLITVSAHQPYVVSSIEGDKYLDLFKDTNYDLDLKRYLSKLKELDNALGVLIEKLEANNTIDDTVFVMFGDHYPYGLNNNTISQILDYSLEDNSVEKTPFVIYNTSMEPKVFDEYTSYINIVPTIANLFDLEYDPRKYMGHDLLDTNYQSRVVFADGSWKNELAHYNASTGKIKYYTDFTYDIDEIKNINNIVNNKINMSSMIIKNNYFNNLEEKIRIKKEEKILANAEGE